MAVITDPDNLDRDQVIFGTVSKKISLYPVGAIVSNNEKDGAATASTNTFTSALATFSSDGVVSGNVLVIKSNAIAGHWLVNNVFDENTLDVVPNTGDAQAFDTTVASANYEVRAQTGGTITDGVTLQAVYSFAKEEWRDDQVQINGDDLIRYQFPFEAITSEQFEVGGGTSHVDWNWFNNYTIKKVRTGGWASKNTAGNTLTEYAGIVTLGSLDSDTQVYFQQTDENTAPQDFTFLGTVNESILTFTNGGADDRTYLKLFARKKARTYQQSEIADIGVSTIQTIVNRFPLSHSTDAAIVDSDGTVLGSSPYRNQDNLVTGSDGVTTVSTGTFGSAGSLFLDANVATGDTLWLISGADIGRYTISTVDDQTTLQTDVSELTSGFAGETTLTFAVSTTRVFTDNSAGTANDWTDGILTANVAGQDGNVSSATAGDWYLQGVRVGDMVIISEAASDLRGVYKVTGGLDDTVNGNSNLTVDTSDLSTDFAGETSIDFRVVSPGMYLSYKKDDITLAAHGDLSFLVGGSNTLTRATGSWVTDGVDTGSVVTVSGSASNDGSYTVASVATNVATLVSSYAITAEENVAATATAYDAYKRSIGGVTYAFKWRLFGNGGTLQDAYQFVQHQLRQTSDIDYAARTFRGDVTDLLMSYSTPTGTALDMFIDDLASADINNSTYRDATSVNRNFPFTAAGSLNFNVNLVNDTNAKYWLYFTNDDAGDNNGYDYGTTNAIIVNDADSVAIQGDIAAQSTIAFTYDYDGNVQRGAASAGEDAPVTLVAVGLDTAQFVITTGTITRSTAISISAVAALERNYSNPV